MQSLIGKFGIKGLVLILSLGGGWGCTLLGSKGLTPPVLEQYDDNGVRSYAKRLMLNWGTRATKAHMLDVGGNVILSSASSAISIASAVGAKPGVMALVGSVFTSLGQALGLIDPPNLANAYSSGYLIISEGQEVYSDCISQDNAPVIVEKKMSRCAAVFLRGINDALHTVNALILGIPPDKDVMARLIAKTQQLQQDAITDAAAKAAAKAAKLMSQKETVDASNSTSSGAPTGAAISQ